MQEILTIRTMLLLLTMNWSSKYLQELIVGGGRARKCEGEISHGKKSDRLSESNDIRRHILIAG